MKRRSFLKMLGAFTLLPSMPPALATAGTEASVEAPFSPMSLKWAETIARSQNRFSVDLIAQQLGLSQSSAHAIRTKLVEKGVINAYADAAGFHRAAKPMYETMLSSHLKYAKPVSDVVTNKMPPDSIHEEAVNFESEINELEDLNESVSDAETDQTSIEETVETQAHDANVKVTS